VWQRKDREEKIRWLRDYRRTYLERDIADVGQVADLDAFALTQKILCSRTGKILSLSEVSRDVSLSVNTVKRYVGLLSRSFQCHLLPPFFENVGKRLVRSPKVFFSDPGMSRAILGEMSIGSGAAYESWVFSELMKWAALQAPEPELFHYRTAAGLEVDFLIATQGFLLPVEVKNREKISAIDGRRVEAPAGCPCRPRRLPRTRARRDPERGLGGAGLVSVRRYRLRIADRWGEHLPDHKPGDSNPS
jgi:hypothetical protein